MTSGNVQVTNIDAGKPALTSHLRTLGNFMRLGWLAAPLACMGRRAPCVLAVLLSTATPVYAGPWASPGDLVLRDDLRRLADAGLIRIPLNTWPLAWGDIKGAVDGIDTKKKLKPAEEVALQRVRRRMKRETRVDAVQGEVRAAGAANPLRRRSFESSPRDNGEFGASLQWTGERFAFGASATLVADPRDGRDVRFDGSYAGVVLGNWSLSISQQDRWWGPGWDGTLLLSSNARPIPALTLERVRSTPFQTRWLSWLGPWKFITFIGELEESRRDAPNAKLFGMRFTFEPLQGLEFGLARSVLWGGRGRPESFSSFTQVLIGNTNTPNRTTDPGSQLGGIDVRWASPIGRANYALYGEAILEDVEGTTGLLPLTQAGVEWWGHIRPLDSNYRLYLEYTDTQAGDRRNIAYNNNIYRDGYRLYGRTLGHFADGDAEIFTVGALLTEANGRTWALRLRNGRLNRFAFSRNIFPDADLQEVFLSGKSPLLQGQLGWGAGYARVEPTQARPVEEDLQAYVDFTVRF